MKLYWNQGFISTFKYISVKISAKIFLENKETTARYYNLLPDQGHDLRFQMKLYKKFMYKKSIYVNSSTVNSFSRSLLMFLLWCVYNKSWWLCMILEVVRIITFLLEIYRHLYICVTYMHKYQPYDFACMNNGQDIFEAVSNHFSSWNLLVCV